VRELLERIRTENPDEPFWQGVDALEETSEGLQVSFRTGADPALRDSGGVEVACVLYPEPVTLEPFRPEDHRRA
jgi:hypothetical protein